MPSRCKVRRTTASTRLWSQVHISQLLNNLRVIERFCSDENFFTIQYVVNKCVQRSINAATAFLSQETQQVKTLLTRRCQRSRFYWCDWKYTFLLIISYKTIWKGLTMFTLTGTEDFSEETQKRNNFLKKLKRAVIRPQKWRRVRIHHTDL